MSEVTGVRLVIGAMLNTESGLTTNARRGTVEIANGADPDYVWIKAGEVTAATMRTELVDLARAIITHYGREGSDANT